MQGGVTPYIYRNKLDKACFNKMCLMVATKTWSKEHNLIKFWGIKRLKLLLIQGTI